MFGGLVAWAGLTEVEQVVRAEGQVEPAGRVKLVNHPDGGRITEIHVAERIRRVVQSLYAMVNEAYRVFAIGWIQADDTVKGGTGWGVELAKLFNRPVWVFDQDRGEWFGCYEGRWVPDAPTLGDRPFAATGTRNLTDAGRAAIADLFQRSLGDPKS